MSASNTNTKEPKLHLLAVVCATLIHEPTYYTRTSEMHHQVEAACEALLSTDPEFVLKTAYYLREELNIRSTANFLLAWAATNDKCKPFLAKYFSATVRLPSDLLEVMSMVTVWQSNTKFPTCLRKVAAAKFAEFDAHSLAKYNKEKAQKQRKKKAAAKEEKKPEAEPQQQKGCPVTETSKMTLKQLIRRLHISEPAEIVMGILGSKYPENSDAFANSKLKGEFDATRAGKRMRLPVPETWETQLSAKGNKHETWEELMDHNKLPFMAMLRNLRNFIVTGISPSHHDTVIGRLTDERSVATSRQLPWRFLSAYDAIKVDLEKMMNDILDHDGSEFKIIQVKVKGSKGGEMRQIKKRVIIPFHMPDLPLIDRYREAVDTAIRLSSAHNLPPVEGRTVIFCDVSGSMDTRVSSSKIPSLQKAMDVGILMGLMLQNACEDCDFRIFSSPSATSARPDLAVEHLSTGSILENVTRVRELTSRLGGGTDFPFAYMDELTKTKVKVDTMVIFSDMMIAPGERASITIDDALNKYRKEVNPDMLFVTVNLAGNAGATKVDPNNDKNVLITGFSDNILRLIAERGSTKQLERVEGVDKTMAEKRKPKEKKQGGKRAKKDVPSEESKMEVQ